MLRTALCTLALAGITILPSLAQAANNTAKYTAKGYTLSITGYQSQYGQMFKGTWTAHNKRYHVEGDWVPAADAGSDLLRFYGKPFPGMKGLGLVAVATLADTCQPNCAASKTYMLKALSNWKLPGGQSQVKLTVH